MSDGVTGGALAGASGAVLLLLSTLVSAQTRPTVDGTVLVVGAQCDRTGPTQSIGVSLCTGYADYIDLVNLKGGVEGHRIRVIEIDHENRVLPAVEAYERQKNEGAVLIGLHGTRQVYALMVKLTEDRIPGTAPGFGGSEAMDGRRHPYLFLIAPSSLSQAAAAVNFAKQQLVVLKGKKIAYLFYDDPSGREPIPLLEELANREGFTLRTFAVAPPGIEMGAQVANLAQRYRPDFTITQLFGAAPSVSIRELKRVGYPLRKVLALAWGGAEATIDDAGGFEAAEGYFTLQFAGVGSSFPVHQEIREMYRRDGRDVPREMASTTYYNRGVLAAALQVEGLRNALKDRPDGRITGADVKAGLERIRGFTLGGLVPPIEITAKDHEGGGWVQVRQVRGGTFARVTDWYRAYPEVVARFVREAIAKP